MVASRPILKRGGGRPSHADAERLRSPSRAASAKHTVHEFTSPSGRRVTFSPFAKNKKRNSPQVPLRRVLADGGAVRELSFDSTALAERERRHQARRRHELSLMRTLHTAAQSHRRGWTAIVREQVARVRTAHERVSCWMRGVMLAWSGVPRTRRVLRSRLRHAPPVYFDPHDRQYVQCVSTPLVAPALLPPERPLHVHPRGLTKASIKAESVALGQRPLVANAHRRQRPITSSHQGSLSSLLRREGIQAEEDEEDEQHAIDRDLRGLTVRTAHHSHMIVS